MAAAAAPAHAPVAGPVVDVLLKVGEAASAASSAAPGASAASSDVAMPAPSPRGDRAHATVPAAIGSLSEATSAASAARYVLDKLVYADTVTAEEARKLAGETVAAWEAHINPGFLQYRKSVAQAEDFAALEWRDGAPGGCTLLDARGREYLDLLGGFGIYSCGHSHPVVVEAVSRQLRKQPLHSQELLDPLRAYCADVLCRTMPPGPLRDGYVFFTNSGTESVEASLKFAMLATGRRHFIGVIGAFHGKSLGSLAATSKAAFRKPFAASLLPFTHIPNNDIAALRRAFESAAFTGNDIAGFIVEPVIGEGGIHICSDDFLVEARALCDKYGACLIADEVQSGMGRTGTMWAIEHAGVSPDIMAIAKGFGGGVMGAGAVVGSEAVMSKLFENPFIHTTTFGGNPMALAAATAALYVTETERLPQAAAARGSFLIAEFTRLGEAFPHILRQVRGRGLMIGLEFVDDDIGYAFSSAMFARRCVVAGTLVNSRVIRIEPPLTITPEECALVIARATHALAALTRAGVGARHRLPAHLVAEFGSGGEAALAAPEMEGPAALAAGLALPPKGAAADADADADGAFGGAGAGAVLESPKAKAAASSSASAGPAPAPGSGAGQPQLTLTAAVPAAAPAAAPASPAPAAGSAPAAASASAGTAGDSDDEVGGVHYHPPKSGEKASKDKAGMRRSKSNGGASGGLAAAAPAAASSAAAASPAGLAAAAPVAAASAGTAPAARAPLSHVAAAVTAAAAAATAAAAAALSLTACEEAAKPVPIAAAPAAAAPAAGAAAPSGVASSAAAAAVDHEDDEDEDEEDDSESDVSSVSSTSTENSGGMDGQSDEE